MVIHKPTIQVHHTQLKFLLSAVIFCGVLVSVFFAALLCMGMVRVMLQHVLAHSKRSLLSEV